MNDIEFTKKYFNTFETPSKKFEVGVIWNYIDGFNLNLKTSTDDEYIVEIYDGEKLLYKTNLKNNMYCKLFKKYFINLKYKILKQGEVIEEKKINLKDKRILISFESSSLGDTIAWIPYCDEFRKQHKCEVFVSTFYNFLFDKKYDELNFIKPGDIVDNIDAKFKIGWFYDSNMEPILPSTLPLQQTITNILGMKYKEIKPMINFTSGVKPYEEKYITIATNSTAGCKLWNHPTGWETLIKHLKSKGYRVINVSKDGDPYDGAEKLIDDSLENTMNVIFHSEFFIGLSSGLSWLSWALNKKVVMISNFTLPDHEFQTNCIRIVNDKVCNGCWNNPNFKFNRGDWYWCPIWKNTPRHFECHKSITPEMVIEQIKDLL
jgi:autotransporter strand-loop-strand O-heptosyltransferase